MWSAEKANMWHKTKKWILGFNYITSTAVNSTEMWQSESIDKKTIETEMAAASGCGYNSCRVFLQYLVWKNEGEYFTANLDWFLDICKKYGITVMPIFLDDCAFSGREPYPGKQDDPKPGIHNSGWTGSPGFTISDDISNQENLRLYIQTIINKFKDDERILAWDLYNEPGNSGRKEKSHSLLKNAFTWARECCPSQPLTAAVWAYLDFDLILLEMSDIISFHDYTGIDITKKRITLLKKYNRPMFCTEWLHRPNGNTFESHVPLYKSENIGIYQWGLVNGKTQTHLNWERDKNINGLPKLWQHDILTKELVPYSETEIEFIRKTSDKFPVSGNAAGNANNADF